jgi:hypothetical protein
MGLWVFHGTLVKGCGIHANDKENPLPARPGTRACPGTRAQRLAACRLNGGALPARNVRHHCPQGDEPWDLWAPCMKFIIKREPTIPFDDECNSNICLWESRRLMRAYAGQVGSRQSPLGAAPTDSSDDRKLIMSDCESGRGEFAVSLTLAGGSAMSAGEQTTAAKANKSA